MVIYYKQNCKRQIFHLLSYLEEFGSMGVDTIEFDPSGSFDEIENSKENRHHKEHEGKVPIIKVKHRIWRHPLLHHR